MDGTLLNKKYNLVERVTALEEGGGYELPVASASTLGGVKIGENLEIDESGVLSASGGAVDYSTSEQATGQKWIDGKDIYFKVINTAITIAALDTWYSTGLTGVDTVINYFPKLTRDGEQIGSTFNGGNLDYVVRNDELLVKGVGFGITDNYVITTQVVYYTKVEVQSKKRSTKKKVEE